MRELGSFAAIVAVAIGCAAREYDMPARRAARLCRDNARRLHRAVLMVTMHIRCSGVVPLDVETERRLGESIPY
jgi:hypothetical protein